MLSSIKEMHYQFKSKLNKIDNVSNIGYKVPEIDWRLKRAEIQLIKERISQSNHLSAGVFEFNNRAIDDLKNIVKRTTITDLLEENNDYFVELPNDYFYFIECTAECTKNNVTKNIRCFVRNNIEEIFAFNTTSFEWEEINLIFIDKGFVLMTDGTFTISKLNFKYIKVPSLFHNAEDYYGTVPVLGSEILQYYNTYNRVPKGLSVSIDNVVSTSIYTINGYVSLSKVKLFGYIDCELSNSILDDIVDIAVNNIYEELTENKQTKQN